MLKLQQIQLYYQPIYNREMKIYGLEILSRLKGSPKEKDAEFLQQIEKSELIVDLTLKQLNTVCELLGRGIECMFSININEHTLSSKRFLEEALNIPPRHIERIGLEISEKIKFKDCVNLVIAMDKLSKAGYLLGLDDFFLKKAQHYRLC